MPSDKDIVVEARELLANAAHGPLELIRYDHGGGRLYRSEPRDLVADFYDAANRELYYRAPELLRALADEVERLRPVVNAAVEWRRIGYERKDEFSYRIGPLLDAVDIYDVGHRRPCEEL